MKETLNMGWNWSSYRELAMIVSLSHSYITQLIWVSEQNSVVVCGLESLSGKPSYSISTPQNPLVVNTMCTDSSC